MPRSMLACCKIYISESRNLLALESIEQAARLYPEAIIINKFMDEAYNRVGYTLVSSISKKPSLNSALAKAAVSMVEAALKSIDLGSHSGTHPRLGVVDHICFHPLAESTLDQSAGLAKIVAEAIGHRLQVPTFLYGAAHKEGRSLDSIRRDLGYFKPNSAGHQWASRLSVDLSCLKPDNGPSQVDPARGVVVVGATRWVSNYNVPVRSTDINAVRQIAKRVSGRGGGFESVQALALAHGEDCFEVACNLLEPDRVGADRVQLEVQRLAAEEGLVVEPGYYTDFSQDIIVDSYLGKMVD
ncbi:hypothetical protein KFK09_027838 [Dendrobium nobile]|uniref:glutamate formimidoyltransferase n=1 Tax=Dendrobium nobile TaxID=94219 RepID=A0A8T3A0B4_DENNO|nr:hypothetical protein KFK09_027838 [Dendrobium nobile]